jgi:hypothetical protein
MGFLFVGLDSFMTSFFVWLLSELYMHKKHPPLFVKYNYPVSAALDCGKCI